MRNAREELTTVLHIVVMLLFWLALLTGALIETGCSDPGRRSTAMVLSEVTEQDTRAQDKGSWTCSQSSTGESRTFATAMSKGQRGNGGCARKHGALAQWAPVFSRSIMADVMALAGVSPARSQEHRATRSLGADRVPPSAYRRAIWRRWQRSGLARLEVQCPGTRGGGLLDRWRYW